MTEEIRHRGPDDAGFELRPGLGFGHRRLAVIDTELSKQPMSSSDGRHLLTYNGEIYNYAELRCELEADGEAFVTHGDTEVLLRLLMKHGIAGLERVNGQFAFAYFDEGEDALWLARDRVGIRPLFHARGNGFLAFASEIKALAPAMNSGFQLEEASLEHYLAHRFVPPPNTLYKGVRALMPGTAIRIQRDGSIVETSYWSFPRMPVDDDREAGDSVERVRELLEDSVELRLRADVPVGVMLSGGLDSTLLAAMVKRARGGGEVLTYTAGFENDEHSELPHARFASQAIGLDHHEVTVSAEDFGDLWQKLTWHRDAPISQASDVAIFQLSGLAREKVKVLLSGEGADELFAGYPKHGVDGYLRIFDVLPAKLRSSVFRRLERALPKRLSRLRILVRALASRSSAERVSSWFGSFTWYERAALHAELGKVLGEELWQSATGDHLSRLLYVDCQGWLSANLLERGDRMLLGNSVEGRVPFLDHRLVELAMTLPANVRKPGKSIVRELAADLVPREILERRKWGFKVPLETWFRGKLREFSHDLLLSRDSFVREFCNREPIEAMLETHDKGRRNESLRIWTLLALEIWHRNTLAV